LRLLGISSHTLVLSLVYVRLSHVKYNTIPEVFHKQRKQKKTGDHICSL